MSNKFKVLYLSEEENDEDDQEDDDMFISNNKELEKYKIECLEEIKELEEQLYNLNSAINILDEKIDDIDDECYNKCSSEMKKKALYDSTKLNGDVINKIEEYDITTECDHSYTRLYYTDNIQCLEWEIEMVSNDIYFKNIDYTSAVTYGL